MGGEKQFHKHHSRPIGEGIDNLEALHRALSTRLPPDDPGSFAQLTELLSAAFNDAELNQTRAGLNRFLRRLAIVVAMPGEPLPRSSPNSLGVDILVPCR